jgi:hypothetical protein
MDLLNRYLQAVKFWLPRAQQDDIIAELRDDIRSEIEERESALGRSLHDSELEDLLKQRGRPLLVAEKYLPQRSLIGPALFPAYWFVLKLVLFCYLIPWVLVWIAMVLFNANYRAQHLGPGVAGDIYVLWLNALVPFITVTIAFAVLEHAKNKDWLINDWSPRKLPPVRNVDGIPRSSSAFEAIAGVIFGIWWLKTLWTLNVLNAGGFQITLDPAWHKFFWAFLPLAIVNIALSATNLVRPYWTKLRRSIRASSNLIAATVLIAIAKNLPPFYLSGNVTGRGTAVVVGSVIVTLIVSFVIGAVVFLIMASVDLWRLIDSSRDGLHLKQRTTM